MATVEKPVFIDTGSGISKGETTIPFELATPETTAKHEAAHTVAAILNRQPCRVSFHRTGSRLLGNHNDGQV